MAMQVLVVDMAIKRSRVRASHFVWVWCALALFEHPVIGGRWDAQALSLRLWPTALFEYPATGDWTAWAAAQVASIRFSTCSVARKSWRLPAHLMFPCAPAETWSYVNYW